jgi:very-short-patch-repair endonuclease
MIDLLMVYSKRTIKREMYIDAKPKLFQRAAEMRKNPTDAEHKLWNILRKYRSQGFLFRQQHPIDIFIADFYCHKLKLVVEVDGEIHSNEEAQEYDDGRTYELEKHGLKVIRFTNEQIENQRGMILDQLDKLMKEGY